MIIDIHSHILPNVDDGSKSIEMSINILKQEALDGVEKVILTPHYKTDFHMPKIELIKNQFNDLLKAVEEEKINIELFLGQEIFCDKYIYKKLQNKEVLTINNTKYILIEFSFMEMQDIVDYVYNLIKLGYIPIIAHFERYGYLDWDNLIELKQMGALVQTNVSAVLGKEGRKTQKIIFSAIKKGIIDFIAGDCHGDKPTNLSKAYKLISKQFGKKVADDIFINNAKKYLSI